MDVALNFWRAEKMNLNILVGTLATLKACLQLPQNRRFTRCVNESRCFVESLPSLVEVSARHVFNHKSDWAGNEEVVKSYKVFIKATKASSSRRIIDSCAVPAALVPCRNFLYILCVLLGRSANMRRYTRKAGTDHRHSSPTGDQDGLTVRM